MPLDNPNVKAVARSRRLPCSMTGDRQTGVSGVRIQRRAETRLFGISNSPRPSPTFAHGSATSWQSAPRLRRAAVPGRDHLVPLRRHRQAHWPFPSLLIRDEARRSASGSYDRRLPARGTALLLPVQPRSPAVRPGAATVIGQRRGDPAGDQVRPEWENSLPFQKALGINVKHPLTTPPFSAAFISMGARRRERRSAPRGSATGLCRPH